MDDVRKDPFEEYIKQSDASKRELGYAWYTAIGLQAVDGLETSDYLKSTARKNIAGEISISEAGKLIESYYRESESRGGDRTREADIVSARIAVILSEKAFTFSVPQYIGIHRRLFQGIYPHAGKVRDYNISKKEWVLDGASVLYGNAAELGEMLEYDIRREKEYSYPLNDISGMIPRLAEFVSKLWQIHAFGEGNTRTTAVFFIKYLRSMGFDVTNDLFAENAWYFRNSLVRANYNNYSAGVRNTTVYLERFLRNLLLNESNELKNRHMHIRWNEEKQDIQDQKQDIQDRKQDIRELVQYTVFPDDMSRKTKQHVESLFAVFGWDRFFGRSEVMEVLGITASPASALLKKMLDKDLICPMKGKGKGKYLFRRAEKQ